MSPLEVLVAVRSVDLRVADGAFLELGIEHIVPGRLDGDTIVARPEAGRTVVAFQANREDYRPVQEFGVHGAVRAMAEIAALHAHRGVLVDENS